MWRKACQTCFTDDAWLATVTKDEAAEGAFSSADVGCEAPLLACAALVVMGDDAVIDRETDVPHRPARP